MGCKQQRWHRVCKGAAWLQAPMHLPCPAHLQQGGPPLLLNPRALPASAPDRDKAARSSKTAMEGGSGQVALLSWPQQPQRIYSAYQEYAGAAGGPGGGAPALEVAACPLPLRRSAAPSSHLPCCARHHAPSSVGIGLPQQQLPQRGQVVARRRVLPDCKRGQMVRTLRCTCTCACNMTDFSRFAQAAVRVPTPQAKSHVCSHT